MYCAGQSNRIVFDSIFDTEGAETLRFDFLLIRYQFDSIYSLIRQKTFSALLKKFIAGQSSRWDPPGCQKQLTESFVFNF